MISRHAYNNLLWIDVENPTIDEVRCLMDEFDLSPVIAEELLSPSIRPKTEQFDDHLYLVLHFPALRHTNSSRSDQEVDFVIGKHFLITVRYDTIDALHKFAKVFEVNAILSRDRTTPDAGDVFFAMVMKLYRAIGHELEYIHDELEEVEAQIFEGREKEMVIGLSNLARDLLNIKQALTPHKEILDSLRAKALELFGDNYREEYSAIIGEYYRINSMRATNADSLAELRETNNSLLSTKQNEIMKVLTTMAFVTLPLSLLASTFGMNAEAMPIVGHPFDFWIIVGLMFSAMLVMFAYFKHNKWL